MSASEPSGYWTSHERRLTVKIELRKVKIAKFASEETVCFQAEVWVDGKKAGMANNQGHGGPNDIYPPALAQRIEEYAKTLPDLESEWGPLKMGADLLISELVSDHQDRKDLERALKRKILYTRKDKPMLWETRKRGTPGEIEAFAKRPEVAKVLNLLPPDEALRSYREDSKPVESKG